MTGKKDFYSILGVPKDAKAADIKKAYRRLARKNHPDVNPGDKSAEERFKKIQEAYDVLSDAKKREVYDQYGFYSDSIREQAGSRGARAGGGPSPGFDFSGAGFGTGDFRDIFSELFGRGRQEAPARGEDLEQQLNISFLESIRGLTARLAVSRRETCGSCGGTGADRSQGTQVCPRCQGSGQEELSQGFMRASGPCRMCGGTAGSGTLRKLRRSGRRPVQETVTVRIPPGCQRIPDEGRGKGNAGRDGTPRGPLPHHFGAAA